MALTLRIIQNVENPQKSHFSGERREEEEEKKCHHTITFYWTYTFSNQLSIWLCAPLMIVFIVLSCFFRTYCLQQQFQQLVKHGIYEYDVSYNRLNCFDWNWLIFGFFLKILSTGNTDGNTIAAGQRSLYLVTKFVTIRFWAMLPCGQNIFTLCFQLI